MAAEMLVQMSLTLSDAATAPLTAFLEKLQSMDGIVNTVNKKLAGLKTGFADIGTKSASATTGVGKMESALAGLAEGLDALESKITGSIASFSALGTHASLAGSEVAGAAGKMALAGDEISATTRKVDGLSSSLKGMAALWAALEIKKGLTSSVGAAAQYQAEEARLNMLNMPKGKTEQISKQAWADSEKYKFVSPLDAINIRKATMDALAEQQDKALIDQTTEAAIKATNVLHSLGAKGNKADLTRQLLSISEMRGQTGDINAIKRNMDLVIKANLATGGKITPADIDMFLRNFGSGAMTMTDQALLKYVGAIDQAKISGGSGGGGNGASRMATAYKMLQAYMMGKPMNKQGAEILQETGIFSENAVMPGSTTTSANIRRGAAKDSLLASQDMTAFIQKYMPNIMAYTTRHAKEFYPGMDLKHLSNEAKDAALQKYIIQLGVSVTAAQALVTALNARSRERINKQVDIANKSDGTDAAQSKLDNTQLQKMTEFHAQLDKLKIAIGESVLPALTKLITKINDLLELVSSFAKNHQFVTAIATWGIAIAGVSLAIRGLAVLFDVAFGGIVKKAAVSAFKITGLSKLFNFSFKGIGIAALSMKNLITLGFSGAVDAIGVSLGAMLAKISGFLSSPIVAAALRMAGGIGMMLHSESLNQGEDAQTAAAWARYDKLHGKKSGHGASGSWGTPTHKAAEIGYPAPNMAGLNAPVNHAKKKKGHKSSFDQEVSDLHQGNILIEDEIKRHQHALAREMADNKISTADYYAKNLADSKRLIQLEVDALQKEHARQLHLGNKSGAASTATQITLKTRDLQDLVAKSIADKKKALKVLEDESAKINAEYTKLSGGDSTAAVIADTQAKGDASSANLRLNGYETAAQKNDDLTKLKIAHLQYAEAMAKVKVIEDQLTESEKALGYAIKAGTITASEAADKQIEMRRKAAADMLPLLQDASAHAVNPGDVKTSAEATAAAQSDLVALGATSLQVKNMMQNSFQGFFDGLLNHTRTLKQSFGDLFKGIASSFASMVAKMESEKLMNAVFGAGSKSGSGSGGYMDSIIGAIFGGGGGSGPAQYGTTAGSQQSAMLAAQDSGMGAASGAATSGIASWITKAIMSFDVGTDYVPHDMLAMVHKGEKITPAKYNNPKSQGGGQVTQHMNFNFDSPQSSQTMMQLAAASGQAIQQAMKRNL